VNIRRAVSQDIPFIVDLERSRPTAAHWDENRYQESFHHGPGAPERLTLVAEETTHTAQGPASATGTVVGFLVARHVASEWELENIAVARAFQRQGVAKRLLSALVDQARQAGSESVYLEVRESNTAARNLYEKAGFAQTGRRKSYYSNPHDDAVLYRKSLI
jgi:ribosomal-protein-alanine N-acetyltransferase